MQLNALQLVPLGASFALAAGLMDCRICSGSSILVSITEQIEEICICHFMLLRLLSRSSQLSFVAQQWEVGVAAAGAAITRKLAMQLSNQAARGRDAGRNHYTGCWPTLRLGFVRLYRNKRIQSDPGFLRVQFVGKKRTFQHAMRL